MTIGIIGAGPIATGTWWRVGQSAGGAPVDRQGSRAFTKTGLCLERILGNPFGASFIQLPPMVRRVPGYRQTTFVSQPAELTVLKTRGVLSI